MSNVDIYISFRTYFHYRDPSMVKIRSIAKQTWAISMTLYHLRS